MGPHAQGEDDAATRPGDGAAAPFLGITGLPPAAEAEMFRSVSLSSPDAVLAADADGVILWANDATERVLGWPPADLVGRPLTDLLPEDGHGEAHAARRALLRGEPARPLQVRARRRDGSIFDASLTPAVRRDPSGRVLGLSLLVAVVSDELRLRDELTDALARSRARFDQVATPQALLDLRARFVAVNDAACRLLGRSREQLLGQDATGLVSPADRAATEQHVDRLRQGRLDSIAYEVRATRGDGVEVPLLIDASVVRDRSGTPREIALFARDLTDVREAHRRLVSQDAFFEALYRRAADVVVVSDVDDRVVYVSPSFRVVLGYSERQVIGAAGFGFLHPDDVEHARRQHRELLTRPGSSRRRLSRVRDATGGWRWFDVVTTNCLDDPAIEGLVANLRDVTTEIEARERLRASEARYRAIVETAQEGILALGADGTVLFANDMMAELTGRPLDTLYAGGLRALLDPEEARRMESRLGGRGASGPERYEVSYHHPDGSRRTWLVAASPLQHDDGTAIGSLGMVSDVTAARQAESDLRHRALHDVLTGLPNRALLVDRLEMAAARQHRGQVHGLAVMFVDLDHFKVVNDSRGHEVGDRVLVEVAARLERAVRETDTVARLGGDEFAVVCENSGPEQAAEVAARVRRALEQPFDVGDGRIRVGASIGVALSPPYDVGDLLRLADAAMYDAKAAGRGRVATFQGGRPVGAQRRLAITAALRETLAAGAVPLGYQPIVDFAAGELTGLEALLRWSHPTLGRVTPDEVLAVAETSGLGLDLDRAVIRQAGTDLVRLRQAGLVADHVAVAVNLSARSARQPRLDELVRATLLETGLPAGSLTLEIPEHAVMDGAEHAAQLLGRLAASGARVALDGFGTGATSLVHLQRLPVSELKIDRSLVRDLVARAEARAVTRSAVALAGAFGLRPVAVGVEHAEQVAVLAELGCHHGQGFLWGPATTVPDLPGLLARWARAPGT